MKKFVLQVFVFLILGFIIGESIIRVFKLYIDVPTMYVDKNGLIKAHPNQEGHTVWGHKWCINRFGEYGYEPQRLDSIFTVIGDSYIANTINPVACHQARLLALNFDSVDFYPSARGGAGFIEFIVIANSLYHLKPTQHLLYVHDSDFIESIIELENNRNKLQWSYKTKQIRKPYFSESKYELRRLLYTGKFAYYIYRNYLLKADNKNTDNANVVFNETKYTKINGLLDYINLNYITENITIIFSPNSDKRLISLVSRYNYKTIELKTNDYKAWQFDNDAHWNCYGHEQVASQVSEHIKQMHF